MSKKTWLRTFLDLFKGEAKPEQPVDPLSLPVVPDKSSAWKAHKTNVCKTATCHYCEMNRTMNEDFVAPTNLTRQQRRFIARKGGKS